MDKKTLFSILFIVACLHVHGVWSSVGTFEINCLSGSDVTVGDVQEPYEGDIESITNIRPDDRLVLESHLFPIGVTFLELVYSPGDSTATVRTIKPVDADVLKEFGGDLFYSVTCTNTGLKNIRTLTVRDINDNPPIFETKTYSVTVSETLPVSSDVLRIRAVDADASTENNRLTYSIQPPAPTEFELRSDGNIRLINRLNYNNAHLYTFTVEATDIEGLSDTATVTIEITDFDNLNPYFDHSLYTASIEENQIGDLTITPDTIKAQDGDTGINTPVVYSITAVSPNEYLSSFSIDSSSGVISVTTQLDREEIQDINVYIQAAQQDDVSKTANAVVSVTVDDVDDNSPEFEQDEYTIHIPENSPVDLFVLQLKVTDPDLGGFVGSFRITSDSVPFSISDDGTIRVKSSTELDRETATDFSFQVEATEKPPSSNTAITNVNVVLLDENDNSPQFGSSKYEGKVYSNQTIGMLVVKVEATDLDEGPNGEVSYAIDFGNDEGYFGINENTGEITLVNTIPLLENTILQFSLYVTAKDGSSRSSSALVHIKAPGDSNPQFLQEIFHGKVDEEQSGADIVKVTFLSIDPVVPVTLTVETEADKFSIDPLTGVLSTKEKLDFESRSTYTVLLSLSDGTNRDEASVEVEVLDINDNDPVFASSPAVAVQEDLAVGDNVTSVTATDMDDGLNGEVQYTLQGGAGRFSIHQVTGVITVAAPLDRETQDEYHLEITAQDQGRPSRSTTTTLDISVTDVNDNAPIFSKQQYEATVSEHATVGTEVITVIATDTDEGTNSAMTYRIAKQEPPSTPFVFSIDAASGSITVAEKLDYGKVKRYTLEVEGQDGGSPALNGSAAVTVWVEDVNDKAPEFSMDQYDADVYENVAGGTALVSLEVTDEDEGGFSKGHFILDSDTFFINGQGIISLRSNATLDRETKDKYILEVIAVDQPADGLSSTAQVSITVLDFNDNNPQFLPLPDTIEIQEGVYTPTSPGEVCVISATDSDIEDNSRVTISVASYSELFSFREDGTLLAVKELDRETQDAYDLLIVAVDHGVPQGNNITTVRVSITDVNDNAPVFSSDIYSKSVLVKDAEVGDLLLTLSATDKDAEDNSLITYSFLEASTSFALDAETGDITLTSDLSEITEDTLLNLTAKATDHGTPSKSSTATVLINIRLVSLNEAVAFESSSYNFSVKENEPADTVVGVVKASGGSPAITVSYNMKSHEDIFTVDGKGTIKALRPLDKEKEEWYIITVEAVDSRTPPTTGETTVSVQVENVNEAPVFDAEKYEAEIFSISPYKFPVVKVQASDPDVGGSSELQYSLQEPTSLLDVEGHTGQLYVLDAAGFGGSRVSCTVKSTDKHGSSTTTTVQVDVKESATDSVVTISLNQPVHTVEIKTPEMQESLKKALGWKVNILNVAADNGIMMRTRETTTKTYISFIAMDTSGAVIPAQEVKEKLRSEHAAVKSELEKVFGTGLEIKVEEGSGTSNDSNQAIIIALSAVLGVSIVGLVVLVTVSVIKFKKMKKNMADSERESFNIGKQDSNKKRSSSDKHDSNKEHSSMDRSSNFHINRNTEQSESKEDHFNHRRDSENKSEDGSESSTSHF